jgi:hypothetical protein
LAPVRASVLTGQPIWWRRVHSLPDFVYFDHRAHVRRGVGCVSCHGRVDQMARVYAVAPLSMQWCLDCHRDPAPHLRPLDRVSDMEWVRGAAEVVSWQVEPPVNNCTGCHR